MWIYCPFYLSLVVYQRGIKTIGEWHALIANVVKFYEGGVQYESALKMPLATLYLLDREADKIIRATKREMEK